MNSNQIALNIWTIRDVTEKDFIHGLTEVAKIGYAGVEIGDQGPLCNDELRKLLADLNLECVGFHVSMGQLESDLQCYIDRNLTLGAKYIVMPWTDEQDRNAAGYRSIGGRLAAIGEKLSKAGIKLCYHNHNFEFETTDGKLGYDYLLESMTDGRLNAELDVYWVTNGYQDPLLWISKLGGRLPLLHIKDMVSTPDRTFCEVGAGIIDMAAVVKAGDRVGVQWYVVEQDVCPTDPIECVRFSYNTLHGLCS